MSSINKISFAIAGCGHIGKRHAAIISHHPECDLIAIADTQMDAVISAIGEICPVFSSIDELLQSNLQPDVICIATPNGLHEEQAIKVLKAGSHVLIEKPMGLSAAGCQKVIDEAAKQDKHIFCVMQNRYSPPAVWLKEITEQKILGNIYMVQVNCYWNRDERYYTAGNWHGTKELDGGVLFTQFSHFIDMLLWIFGDIENISSRFSNFNHQHLTEFDDSGFVNFSFKNGGIGCLNFSTAIWNQNLESSITIIAQNGTVKIGGQYMNEVQVCNIKDYTMPQLPASNPANDYGAYKGSAANHHFVFENVVNVLKGKEPVATTATEGMKVVEVIERIYKA